MSARAFSFANMSLRDQELYIKSKTLIQTNLPFLFGVFSYNNTNTTNNDMDNIKPINFSSRIYNYNGIVFESIAYNIINLKDSTYIDNKIAMSKEITLTNNSNIDKSLNNIVLELTGYIQGTAEEIENKQQVVLKELKAQLKLELEQSRNLFEKLKTFET